MRKSRLFMSAAAACLAGTMAVTGFAATEHWNDNSGKKAISDEWSQWKTKWETIKTDYEKISMVPGADATKLNYAWYSKKADEAKVRISTNVDMSKTTEADGSNTYSENYKEFTGTSKEYKKIDDVTYYANKVTITELKENTTYYYQCLVDGKWTSVKNSRQVIHQISVFSMLEILRLVHLKVRHRLKVQKRSRQILLPETMRSAGIRLLQQQ